MWAEQGTTKKQRRGSHNIDQSSSKPFFWTVLLDSAPVATLLIQECVRSLHLRRGVGS
jgi:hypothetical protein